MPPSAPSSVRIGYIGLGGMGWPMLSRLRAAGHPVRVWARNPERVPQLAGSGIELLPSPAALARAVDVVCTNVTSTADVEQVLLGSSGVVHGATPGLLCIDHSTIAPNGARQIAQALAERGIAFVEAPVSGGVQGARDGTLSIMAGGSQAEYERALPLLRLLGSQVRYLGPSGSAQVCKLCNQLVQVVTIQGIAEAMRLAAAQGCDLHQVLQALAAGFAGSRMLDLMGPKMAQRDFRAGIEARLHAKDFGLLDETARQAGLRLPAQQLVLQQLRQLMAEGWGGDDTSSLLRVLELDTAPPG